MEHAESFQCAICSQLHHGLPDIGYEQPDIYWTISAEERSSRLQLTSDTCILDSEHYFIRGVIEIPIMNTAERFGFGVWVTQKRENFFTYRDNPDSDEISPFFGWLSTRIGYYPEETMLLKTRAHFRGDNQRPSIEVESTDHPLSLDQRNGITLAKAWEIVHFYFDPSHK